MMTKWYALAVLQLVYFPSGANGDCDTRYDVDNPPLASPSEFCAPAPPPLPTPPTPAPSSTVHFVDFHPYIWKNGNSEEQGAIKELLKKMITDGVCHPDRAPTMQFTKHNGGTTQSLLSIPGTSDMAAPVTAPVQTTAKFVGAEYQDLWQDVEIAFFTMDAGLWFDRLNKLGTSFLNSWPLGLIILMLCMYSGLVIWILEKYVNAEDFPKAFPKGPYEGGWWSFISITTVGYGDHAPISLQGRIFAIVWILVGITLVSMYTGGITSSITATTTPEKEYMIGQKIGVLDISPAARYLVNREGGIAVGARDIDHLHFLIATGKIKGIAMDVNVAAYHHKHTLSRYIRWRLQDRFQSNFRYGMIFRSASPLPTASSRRTCINTYIEGSKDLRSRIQRDMLDGVSAYLDYSILRPVKFDGLELFDHRSEEFQRACVIMAMILVALIIFGILFECYMRKSGLRVNENNLGYEDTKANSKPEDKEKQLEKLRGKDKGGKSSDLTEEEKRVTTQVERSIAILSKRFTDTERQMQFELMELSRTVRREMLEMKRNQQAKEMRKYTNPVFSSELIAQPGIVDVPGYTVPNEGYLP